MGTQLYLPPHMRQSVNRAELQAVIDVVRKYKHQRHAVAVATDFAYVHDGLQGKAMQWEAQGWVTTHPLVINVDLWEEVLAILLTSNCEFKWVKVPSHVSVDGNEKADHLAEQGRNMSPLYLTVRRAIQVPPPPPMRRLMGDESGPGTWVEITPLFNRMISHQC